MTLKERLKHTAQVALDSEYGFKPSLKEIILLEGSDDRTYIRFMVKHKTYVFNSYAGIDGSVWCGSGTIEKVD